MNECAPTIRAARAADADTIADFNTAMAAETEQITLHQDTVRAGVLAGLADGQACRYFLAEMDGAIVGQTMVTFEWSDWRNGVFWWIQSVYVDPAYRGRGVFKALYRHVHELARAASDVCGLRLYVYNRNRRAIEIYKKLGMSVTDYVLCEEDWSGQP